jgi:23S rRNA (cytidine2498-2'-O)-methyltransferase
MGCFPAAFYFEPRPIRRIASRSMSTQGALAICQPGYEAYLAREMEALGLPVREQGPGWVATAGSGGTHGPRGGWEAAAFAHQVLEAPVVLAGDRVNELARQLLDWFTGSLRGERVAEAWPCVFAGGTDAAGMAGRAASVESAFRELLARKLGRVARLASPHRPRLGPARGLFVWFTDFGRAQASREAFFCGPARMADDPAAPSRSYLKIEEAYGIIGAEPRPGESVCDLGAAPGGWSYSAAKRGARVVAVDNGPLKGGALGHPSIEHRNADAFGFSPGREASYDWLLCDLLEDPYKVLRSILAPWLEGRWCRRFVVNLKFGRVDPIALLAELRGPRSPLARATGVRIVHLYHDREELTVTGTTAP